ncbi:MAG TPA: hypothetical protein DEB12_07745 [Porphyromonadaceae bacterium]|jgi:O-antigen/teichoic acid export membrane protein|nr:hypothetical protein [Porphyromonadaceae bacterium]
MQGGNKLIAKNTLIIYVKLIINAILGLFTSRFIFKGLGAEDFGLYSVVGSIVVMMAFINTVMISTTYRFIAYEMGKGDTPAINRVFNISLTIHICLAFIIIFITETLGVFYVNNYLKIDPSKLSDALFVLRFSVIATVFNIISIPFQGMITALEKFSVRSAIEVIDSVFKFLIAFALIYYVGNRLRFYSLLIALIALVGPLLYFGYCKYYHKSLIKWNFQKDKFKYKEMISFSGWILFGAAASVGQKNGSALIINHFFGTFLNAAYGIASTVNSVISAFSGSLAQSAIPQITKSFSKGNRKRSEKLTAYISKYTALIMLIISVPILLETEFLITLWLGEVPEHTIIFCKLIIINALIQAMGAGLPAFVQATGKIKWFQIILSTTSLASLPIAWYLFKIGLPPYSIIITFIFTAIINLVVRQVLLNKIVAFDSFFFIKTSYFRVLLVIISVLPLFYLINFFEEGITRFILMFMVSIAYLIASIYLIGLDKDERNKIKSVVLNFKI